MEMFYFLERFRELEKKNNITLIQMEMEFTYSHYLTHICSPKCLVCSGVAGSDLTWLSLSCWIALNLMTRAACRGGYRGHWAAVTTPRPNRCQLNNIVRRCDSLTKPSPGRSDTMNLLFRTHWAMNTLQQRLRYSRRHTYSSHWIFYTERFHERVQRSVKQQRLSHFHLSSALWHVVRPLTSRRALPNTRLFPIYNRIVISGRWWKGAY